MALSEYQKQWERNRYERFKEQGKCARCGKENDRLNKVECSKCTKYSRKLYLLNCEKIKNYSREKGRKNREIWWNQVLEHYGKQCACCGEKEYKFLTIDHINNDGAKHRKPSGGRMKSDKLYRWLVLNNYPKDFQILCWNCNCGKYRNKGICPHISKEVKEGGDVNGGQ